MTTDLNDSTTQTGSASEEQLISLTETAAKKLQSYLEQEGQAAAGLHLRVTVRPGGCAGFMQEINLDQRRDTDYFQESFGIGVVIDPASAEFVKGLKIDYVDSISESGFTLDNPNQTSSCGCGKSFC